MYRSFSVLMAVYDGEKAEYFREALESLCMQRILPSETVIVIDGPIRDELHDIVLYFRDNLNIKCIQLPTNLGLAHALKMGLENCNNELVARMDSDDIAKPERFDRQLSFMELHPNIDVLGSTADVIDANSVVYDSLKVPERNNRIQDIIWACPIIHPSVMFRRSKILSIGNYSTSTPRRQEDYELWIRSKEAGLTFHNLQCDLISYRKDERFELKNGLDVGFNRFKLGIRSALQSSSPFYSCLSLTFPVLRPFIPRCFTRYMYQISKRFDPRNT